MGQRARSGLSEAWAGRPDWLRRRAPVALLASLVLLLVLFLWALSYLGADQPGRHLTLDELAQATDQGEVDAVTFRDEDAVVVGTLADGATFSVQYPSSDALTETLVRELAKSGAVVEVDGQGSKQAVRLIATF